MKVCAIILLYKRVDLIDQLTQRLKKCGVDGIIVVRNDLINSGSAKGYGHGIELAQKTDCDFFWLLDDDNLPEADALDKLKAAWIKGGNKRICLTSYRACHKELRKAINIEVILGSYNAALSLNIFHPITTRKNSRIFRGTYKGKGLSCLPCTVYGGMFFHRELIDVIGLPDESYFLYCDDFEWSYRITANNGHIMLVEESKMNDLPAISGDRGINYFKTRNYLRFQKKLAKNRWMFNVNLFLYGLIARVRGDEVLNKAIRDV